MKPTTIRDLRLLVNSKKRVVTDTIAWLLFFLLTLGYWGLNYTFQEVPRLEIPATTEAFFSIFVKNSLVYTLVMTMPVYANLCLLKPYLLDRKFNKFLRYGLYLLGTLLLAFLTSWGLYHLAPEFLDLKNHKKWLVDVPVVFGTQIIACGLLYLRALQTVTREYHRLELQKAKVKQSLKKTEQQLEELTFSTNHIKIGTTSKFTIIPYESILYFEGDGNFPNIYTLEKKEPFPQVNYTLKRLEEKLPNQLFKRIHKSYIIGKTHIKGKKEHFFLLRGLDFKVPIGDTYREEINQDDFLGFQDSI